MTRSWLVALLFGLALVSLACFAIPIYVIRPFRHQGATELAVALFVKQIGPWLSAACGAAAALVVISAWRPARWKSRTALALGLILAVGGAFLARFNVYEQMFHPFGAPQVQAAADSHVDKDDMIIAVKLNGESRAYPVREMAYHHIVNDTLGGEPIASTY